MFRFLLSISLLLTTSLVSMAGEPQSRLTDPEHWEFLGPLKIEVGQLRDALATDIEVLLASRAPLNPEKLAAVLAERLAAGYRNSGFPEVEVTHEIISERQRIALMVKEGPHYRNGDVRVDGAKTLPAEELIEGLTEGTGPKDAFRRWTLPREQGGVPEWVKANGEKVAQEAAVWKKGNATTFGAHLEQNVATTAKLILQRCGYIDPVVATHLEPQSDGLTTLVVEIQDEGPREVVGDIEIHGNQINSVGEILKYLDIKAGQSLDTDSSARWQWKLQESARFYESKVEITPPPFGTGPSRLDVHLIEIPDLPKLSEPETPIQQASIRAARWMTAPKTEDWQLTAVLKLTADTSRFLPYAWDGADTVRLQWTLSAVESAMILEVDVHDANLQSVWAMNVHLGGGQLQLLNLTRRAKITFHAIDAKMVVTANWSVRKPDEQGRSSIVNFGCGINHRADNQPGPPELKTVIAPAAILVETRRPEFKTTLDAGLLRLVAENSLIEFDAETGRLRQFDCAIADVASRLRLRAETGLYRQRLQEQSKAYAACTEVANERGWFTTTCNFLLDEVTELGIPSAEQQKSLGVCRRLLDAGVFRVLDEHLARQDAEVTIRAGGFEIPPPNPVGPPHPLAWLKPFLHVALSGYTKVFPRETGAWVAGREAALALVGGRQGAVQPTRLIEVLDEADAGPISFLLAAEMFHFVSPYHRYVLSNAAMDRLDSTALRSDLRVLTDERSIAGKVVLAAATALRDAPPDDLAVIAGWMTKRQFDDVLRPAFRELSRRKDEPLSQVLPDVLEQIYPALIRPVLVAELQRLEMPIRAANAQGNVKPVDLPVAPFEERRPVPTGQQPPEDISKRQFLPNRD